MPNASAVATAEGSEARDLRFIVRLTGFCILVTILGSWPLYAPGLRIYALAPVIQPLLAMPNWLNWGVLYGCMALLVSLVAFPKNRVALAGVLLCFVFWILQDINRLTPLIWMYGFPLVIALFCNGKRDHGLDAIRIMLCGIYFWAGFHKINATFYHHVIPWFIEPLHKFSPDSSSTFDGLVFLAMLAVPFFESAIGILLFFPKWRKLATCMAFTMLVTVLICLGPFGHSWGTTVWVWNVYLFLIEYRLFLNSNVTALPISFAQLSRMRVISVALYVVAPVLAIYSAWYSFPGFKLYSGNTIKAFVLFSPREPLDKLPQRVRLQIEHRKMDLMDLGAGDVNTAPYPVPSIFKISAQGLCPYLKDPNHTVLQIVYPAPFYSLETRNEDMPLCHD